MTPEQYEQQQLAELEERYQWTTSQLASSMPTNHPATLEELRRAADYTHHLVDWFRTTYGPTASSLQAAGFSKLAHRLNALLADLQQAYKLYVSMAQKKRQPPPPPNPPTGFPPPRSDMIPTGNQRNEMIRASFLDQCWQCQLQFEAEEFFRLVYCPRCNAMLHP